MKYICTKQDDDPDGKPGIEEIFLFPKHLEFSVISPLLNIIKNENWRNWHRVKRKPISCGDVKNNVFISSHISSDDLLAHLPSRAQMDAELYKKQIYYDCKYIIVKAIMYYPSKPLIKIDENGNQSPAEVEEIYVFPKAVHHDCFYEAINNQDEYREIVSAGFVDSDLNCHGSSETLGVKSRPEDTKLLKKEMAM